MNILLKQVVLQINSKLLGFSNSATQHVHASSTILQDALHIAVIRQNDGQIPHNLHYFHLVWYQVIPNIFQGFFTFTVIGIIVISRPWKLWMDLSHASSKIDAFFAYAISCGGLSVIECRKTSLLLNWYCRRKIIRKMDLRSKSTNTDSYVHTSSRVDKMLIRDPAVIYVIYSNVH